MADASSDAGPRVALVRLGCRVAQADAEAVLEACSARPALRGVDVVLVSTCVVTGDAESTAMQAVRRAAREHPGVPVVVYGCAGALRRGELAALSGVAAVVEPGAVAEAAHAVRDAAAAGAGARRGDARRGERDADGPGADGDGDGAATPARELPARGASPLRRARPTLKIQDGCDQRCAYCVVPLARGRSRSLPFAAALERLALLGREADEVVLAGIHLGAYGADLPAAPRGEPPTLTGLVTAVAARRLVHRVRLSSIDPLEVPFAALTGAGAEVLCAQLHLPLQSGSDPVLARMRRPYSARAVAGVVERIWRTLPLACIGADVITGFPGETDADHRATIALVTALPLAALHVFPFSPREGTPAAAMPDRVPAALARDRAAELREVSDRAWRRYVDGLADRDVEAVVERVEGANARGTTREGVLARWTLAHTDEVPARGRAVRLRAIAREGEALRCEPVARTVPGE